MVRELFMARENAPAILLWTRWTPSAARGSGGGDSEVQRTMLELLNQLDGFEASNKIKGMARTDWTFGPRRFVPGASIVRSSSPTLRRTRGWTS